MDEGGSVRLSQLLGRRVLERGGRELGRVHDVRLVRDGPEIGSFGAAFRVHGLIVGTGAIGTRLGLEREQVKGPWPLTAAARRLHADRISVHWSELWSVEEDAIRVRSVVPAKTIHVGPPHTRAPGQTIDAGLQLLDRQIVDVEGRMAGKVDDLELAYATEPGAPPSVVAILAGPGALSHRLGGRLGLWLDSAQRRLADDPAPAQISFGVVKRIGNHLELSVARDELGVMRFERWVRDRIIARIPGADGR
jgi:sporulation protein YlmC with PRC-barrel domain